jgi:polar amino acid transport system substrate-binding protein
MRKILLGVTLLAFVAVACGEAADTAAPGATDTATDTGAPPPATAADCAAEATFVNDGVLTVGTDNPAYPPYFQGGTTKESDWKINDPNTGEGFESAVGYEIGERLGFSEDEVEWTVVRFAQSYAPGPKSFDLDINQISYSSKRANAVDFSESYYDVNQAIVVVNDTPIAGATSVEELGQYTLAAPLGTTSYDLITEYIQPDADAGVYQTLADAIAALNAGQVDGVVVDYPTALYVADPYVQEVENSTVLAQFPNEAVEGGEYFGTVQEKDSSLTPCINQALQEMKEDGTLDQITQEWLSEKTNVGEVPVFAR